MDPLNDSSDFSINENLTVDGYGLSPTLEMCKEEKDFTKR